jgi:transcriptional regulator with XRE-family HTH domain
MTETRFGTQAARERIRAAGYTVAQIAELTGAHESHLYGVLQGRIRPDLTVRRRLPEVLKVPIEELFTVEVLSAPPNHANPKQEPPARQRKRRVHLLREGQGEQVTLLWEPPHRGDTYEAADGGWVVWDAWRGGEEYYVKLRRPEVVRDSRNNWPLGTWPANA